MQIIIIILLLIILILAIFLYEENIKNKKTKRWLQKQYGKKPFVKQVDFEKVSTYWTEISECIPEDEKLDDITWNDLEMNHIFYRINTCCSFVGDQITYATLHCLPRNKSYGEIFEERIEYYVSNTEEREEVQLLLCSLGKEDISYYLPLFMNNLDAFEMKGIWGYRILQILLILSPFTAIIFRNQLFLFITLAIFLINIILYSLKKMKYEVYINSFNSIVQIIKVGKKLTDSKRFSEHIQFGDMKKKVESFKKLVHVVGRIQKKKEASYSGDGIAMIYDYVIGATLWDFILYDKVMRVLKGKKSEYMELYRQIGEIDMNIAVASFRESLPKFCTPVFCKDHNLDMEEIYHPLVDEPAYNSIVMDRNSLITGSNASGKSTFIKAVAINAILAQSINTCMAKRMVLPYTRIITSMAVRDDLMAGESYYIKEIKYLNRIIKSLSSEQFIICAIDEILRGTNTEERIAASASILKYLSNKNCITIVASHDLELAKILDFEYDNYHFQEQIRDKDIIFDYKIHKGTSNSKNAIKLLEYEGFPKEIIENARRFYNNTKE